MNKVDHQYAIYVTPKSLDKKNGFHDKTFPWGGYHITIGGFQSGCSEEKLKGIIGDIANNILSNNKGSSWAPAKLDIKEWKGVKTLVIGDSKTLREISQDLQSKGIKDIKYPDKGKGRFHISLPFAQDDKEAQKVKDQFMRDGREWQLTLVRSTPALKNNCEWIANFDLGVVK